MITINRANGRAVYTITNIKDSQFRTHEELTKNIGQPSEHSLYEAKRRAFKRIEDTIYCNKDKIFCFVTLTYKYQHSDTNKIQNDLKNYFTRKGISYIAVIEKHKSGNYHIHAMTSPLDSVYKSGFKDKRGNIQYKWEPWERNLGITDVKFISGVDNSFHVERYMFKYMAKSEKIGGRYFYKSRDFKVFHTNVSRGGIPTELIHHKPLEFSYEHVYNIDEISTLVVRKEYYGND